MLILDDKNVFAVKKKKRITFLTSIICIQYKFILSLMYSDSPKSIK